MGCCECCNLSTDTVGAAVYGRFNFNLNNSTVNKQTNCSQKDWIVLRKLVVLEHLAMLKRKNNHFSSHSREQLGVDQQRTMEVINTTSIIFVMWISCSIEQRHCHLCFLKRYLLIWDIKITDYKGRVREMGTCSSKKSPLWKYLETSPAGCIEIDILHWCVYKHCP